MRFHSRVIAVRFGIFSFYLNLWNLWAIIGYNIIIKIAIIIIVSSIIIIQNRLSFMATFIYFGVERRNLIGIPLSVSSNRRNIINATNCHTRETEHRLGTQMINPSDISIWWFRLLCNSVIFIKFILLGSC